MDVCGAQFEETAASSGPSPYTQFEETGCPLWGDISNGRPSPYAYFEVIVSVPQRVGWEQQLFFRCSLPCKVPHSHRPA